MPLNPAPIASLRCPLCRQPLTEQSGTVRCEQGHSFDRARQGYLNLLPVQHKRSKAPGDDAAMVAGRREFLEQGHYQLLSDRINQLLLSHLPAQQSTLQLCDAGCGEGYYSTRLHQALEARQQSHQLFGIDISKAAIRAACRRSKTINWLVASSRDLPLIEQSQDGVLCLFAPHNSKAFHRALRPGGLLLLATTGADHLLQLRQLIYPQVRRQAYDPLPSLTDHFEPLEQAHVQYPIELKTHTSIQQLLAMTPHQWRASQEARQRISEQEKLTVELDIHLHLLSAHQ